uniref:Uncharacterized protein n=2 Tax=Clastoptera arizonana TaxID=38151 RepID=A0A1B6C526_9HEMI
MGFLASVVLLSVFFYYVIVAEEVSKPDNNKDVHHATSSTGGGSYDLYLPNNVLAMLATGGSVTAGAMLVAALGVLILQTFGIRFCQVMGNCESPNHGYSANLLHEGFGSTHQQAPSYPSSPTAFQMRSLEYAGPVLSALKTAYDKYGSANEPSEDNKTTKK